MARSETGPRRSWAQRLVLSFNVLLVLVCLTAAVGLAQYYDDVSQIHRISGQGTLADIEEPMDPVNFLLVGVDNAEGIDDDDPVLQGRSQESLLADTIMIARMDPERNRAWLLSIPRDLYVPISGSGGRDRINSALALGGPSGLIETIQDNFGMPIHHYVQVNFAGFMNLVETIGGVPVWFAHPGRDRESGLFVEETGCVNLDGEGSLAFVRSRAYEAEVDGSWRTDPTADRGRMGRQQVFVRAALNRAIAQGARNPFELQRMLEASEGEVVLDDSLSIDRLINLAERFADFNPAALESFALPTDDVNIGGAAVAELREGEAQPIFDLFRGQSVFGTPTAVVRVEVLNGSGIAGQAASAAEELEDDGFTVVGTGDAPEMVGQPTTLRYAPEHEVLAVFLARFLPSDPQLVPLSEAQAAELGDAGVELVTGHDWEGVLDEPRQPEEVEHLLEDPAAGDVDLEELEGLGEAGEDEELSDPQSPDELEMPGVDEQRGINGASGTGDVEAPDDEDPSASITTTTVTPEEFVPEPPPGERCG